MSEQLIKDLNASTKEQRLEALRGLMALYNGGKLEKPVPTGYVNNHIHTIYSFSPYSPTMAAYMAWKNGLQTAGIMDHDSVAGGEEFIEAGRIIGIATTVGFEVRCSLDHTPFKGMRLNNPDQKSISYLSLHGIPHSSIAKVQAYITPYRNKRNIRNRAMTENLNKLLAETGLHLDFEKDVAAISQDAEGGSITERHILYALACKMAAQTNRGQALLDFLQGRLGIPVTGGNREKLLNPDDSMYEYYLLGVLKSQLVERFYIPATDECPPIADFVRMADEMGAIAAYPYLGDICGSVTGDKKDQTFEDAFLDDLIAYMKEIGFRAVTYMPTRNTPAQLSRLIALCDKLGMFQISGEDINTPFQSFICKALDKPEYQHLITATWALIGHERAASEQLDAGMFTPETLAKMPGLNDRIAHFEGIGRG